MSGPTNFSTPKSRETFRDEVNAKIPAGYSPWFHLIFPSLCGIGLIVTSLVLLRAPVLWEWAMVAIFFVILNASEWRLHRDVLHKRVPGMSLLYDRHTPLHHVVFITEDMAIRSRREWLLVLIPPWAILGAFATLAPIVGLAILLGHWNLGMLFMATAMAYIVSYEWLHLSYHLAPDSMIGRLCLIRVLRRHHATHHNPALMQKWNFNVSIPLWDLVRGTIYRAQPSKSKERAGAGATTDSFGAR
jgi:hypothetical protein